VGVAVRSVSEAGFVGVSRLMLVSGLVGKLAALVLA